MFAAHTAALTTDEKGEERPTRTLDPRLQKLALEHYDFVWRSLRRLGITPPETDDATQQVFLILSRKLSSVREGEERSYIFGIAMRVAANVRRGRASTLRREVPESDAPESLSQATAETSLRRARARAVLDDILAGMSEERRVIFVLFELEELTKREIADMLDIPMGTVSSRLRRAREDFDAAVTRLHARNQGV